jgi:hypothetical protein
LKEETRIRGTENQILALNHIMLYRVYIPHGRDSNPPFYISDGHWLHRYRCQFDYYTIVTITIPKTFRYVIEKTPSKYDILAFLMQEFPRSGDLSNSTYNTFSSDARAAQSLVICVMFSV